jgi:hypothetical protein
MNDLDLMSVRLETLYTLDPRGRLVQSNEPDGQPAPRLFLGRTRGGTVVRFGPGVPDSLARRLAEIVEREPAAADPLAPFVASDALLATLESHAPVAHCGGGPAYRFPETLVGPSGVVPVSERENASTVHDTFPWVLLPAWQPCFAVVRDGVAVSVCFTSRNGARAAEAGVDTRPEYRGRGYATAVTAAWGAAIREQGRVPLYSTGWSNLASQGVARRLGLVCFGTDAYWH